METKADEIDAGVRVFDEIADEIARDAAHKGGAFALTDEQSEKAKITAGYTMFDTPASDDALTWVLVPRDRIERLPSQASVRIESRDGRVYLGTVVRGPFTIPDGLKADSVPVVATTLRGGLNGVFLPEHHGLVAIEVAGEEKNGAIHPHRFRPLPNSAVIPLNTQEIGRFWRTGGNIRLGLAFGHENLPVSFDLSRKEVLPRHLAILGTTGGGKSTTVARIISELGRGGAAVILLDTEGEYTTINEPTKHDSMVAALQSLDMLPQGIPDTHILHLVGRETTALMHPDVRAFSPQFSRISPYAAMEIFDFNDAQQERYQAAIMTTVRLLEELKIWSDSDITAAKTTVDEFDEGYPKMRLSHVYDVARCIADLIQHKSIDSKALRSADFQSKRADFDRELVAAAKNESNWSSWRKVQGRIGRIERLDFFDHVRAEPLNAKAMLDPGRITVIDLSDSDSPLVNNLVISELLREVQREQDVRYQEAVDLGNEPTPVVVMIEEAHEFLSAERLAKMPILHQQVARIAKRGRKRWLGLCFITQLPQHLPDAILGLVNNYILHKIADQSVVVRLKRTVGGIDDGMWSRLSRLALGQAIVSLASLSRPVLTAIDPAPCQLRMVR